MKGRANRRTLKIEEVRELKNSNERDKRFAYEGYVRAKDEWYWNMTKRLVTEKIKKVAVLAVTSAAISGIVLAISVSSLLHKFQLR